MRLLATGRATSLISGHATSAPAPDRYASNEVAAVHYVVKQRHHPIDLAFFPDLFRFGTDRIVMQQRNHPRRGLHLRQITGLLRFRCLGRPRLSANSGGPISRNPPFSVRAPVRTPPLFPAAGRFVVDSPLEGAGFELSIPRPWRAQLRVESLDIQGVGHGVRRRG